MFQAREPTHKSIVSQMRGLKDFFPHFLTFNTLEYLWFYWMNMAAHSWLLLIYKLWIFTSFGWLRFAFSASVKYVIAVFIFDTSKFQCFIVDLSAPCPQCVPFFYIISNNFHSVIYLCVIYALETFVLRPKLIMFRYFASNSLSFSKPSIKCAK